MLDYGIRSKCCLAPVRVGMKKVKKTNQKITVWVCCTCSTKDVHVISYDEAKAIKEKDQLALEISDDGGFSD